jgi:hypothetical protein
MSYSLAYSNSCTAFKKAVYLHLKLVFNLKRGDAQSPLFLSYSPARHGPI